MKHWEQSEELAGYTPTKTILQTATFKIAHDIYINKRPFTRDITAEGRQGYGDLG